MATLDNFRLVVFRAVAEQRSFRKAAEKLYLTQPAVSLQIKALEEELSVELFDRSGANVKLTAAGAILLEHARRSSEILGEAAEEIAALNGAQAGELTLGASTTIAQYLMPRLLAEFRRLNPRVHLRLTSGNTEAVVRAVEERKILLGFIEGPPRSRNVTTEPFLEDELVLIAPVSHDLPSRDLPARNWTGGGLASAADLARIPLLMRERGSGTRRIVEMALSRYGVKRSSLQITMELDSTEAIKSAVEAGLGAGFVSRWALAKDARLGRSFAIVEIDSLRIRREFLVVAKREPEQPGLAREFRRFIRAHAAARQAQLERARKAR